MTRVFGALPFLVGTLLTSFIALIISIPFSLSIAIFLGEYATKGTVSSLLKSAVELLAGIPSIVYGFWGIFVLVPLIRNVELKLGVAPYGVGILTASVVLAIMIIPYSASIAAEVIQLVPADLKEAAYSLGATRFEVVRRIIVTYARSGIFAGILLALGRALGETMAVTMVIGNSHFLPTSHFQPRQQHGKCDRQSVYRGHRNDLPLLAGTDCAVTVCSDHDRQSHRKIHHRENER